MLRVSCTGSKQFCCPNYPPLGSPKDLDIELNHELLLDPPFLGLPPPPLEYYEEFSRNVAVLHVAPELHEVWYDIVYGKDTTFDAVILDAYGLGNLPSNTKLTELISLRSGTGLQTFVTTQCHNGNVSADYASSAERLGGILCFDMSLPAIYCKVSIIAPRAGKSTEQARRLLGISIHGEISPPDQGRLKLQGWIYRYFEGLLEPYLGEKFAKVFNPILQSIILSGGASSLQPIIQDALSSDGSLLEKSFSGGLNIAHMLAFQNNNELLELLKRTLSKERLSDLLQSKDEFGISPLGYCMRTRKATKVEEICSLCAENYEPDETLRLNLQASIAAGDHTLLEKVLLASPHKIEAILDIEKRNLLHISCFQGSVECVKLLTSKTHLSEETIKSLLKAKDLDGLSPEALAKLNKQDKVLGLLQQFSQKTPVKK
jgi:Glutaminase/Asparaginase C-terminal domain